MLSRTHVIRALEEKRNAFAHYERRNNKEIARYQKALDRLTPLSQKELEAKLAHVPRPGALPTMERRPQHGLVRPFAHRWPHHRAARTWAFDLLQGIITYAVDGSQIAPTHDFSFPVGAIQIGWFENKHKGIDSYVKDIAFEVLSPDELRAPGKESSPFSDLIVNLRRFESECQHLVRYMHRAADQQPPPICFYDGSLAISFAAKLAPPLRQRYLRAVRTLLRTSRETKVPLVGYVATSYANDLTNMLGVLSGQSDAPQIADAPLLRSQMRWGDRTEAYVCARDDALFDDGFQSLDYYPDLIFLYLKTTASNIPARLELPAWVLNTDRLDWVVDVVRAECVVGTGYPYATETADAVAVITAKDRQRFYRLFQDFLAQDAVSLRYSTKSSSKQDRR